MPQRPGAIAEERAVTANKWSGDVTEAPRSAMQFRSICKFAGDAAANGALVPFTMTARTGDPVDHWWWGRCVHDMSGMQLGKDVLPVDWCHDADEIMGFADKFKTDSGDLVVSGSLTPMPDDDDDRAAEVIYKQKLGVPYEASIDFSGDEPVIEYIPEGTSVGVNGKQFDGPGVIFREWTLRSVAICPYGQDPDTCTEFSGSNIVRFTAVNKSNEGKEKMSKANEANPAAPATTPAPATPAAAAQLAATPAMPATETAAAEKPEQKYIKAFGDIGARWFLDKKPFEDCVAEHLTKLSADHTAEMEKFKKQAGDEKAALAAIARGDQGVTFSNAEGTPAAATAQKLSQGLSEGTARFAAGMSLPSTNKK
jgi:hypothetical protein